MTLNHSKSWPVSTFAVVQLRVDSEGHIYSAISKENGRVEENGEPSGMVQDKPSIQSSQPMLPSREQYQAPSDPTIQSYNPPEEATALNGPPRPENDHAGSNGNVGISTKEQTSVLPLSRKHLEMFAKISPPPPQYRATVRTDTVSTILDQEFEYDQEECRRPSIRVDNWDYIYTERVSPEHVAPGRLRCPIHRYGPEPPHRRDSDEPELPLDARKSATLKKHYYLEGGWGWIIVVCSVMVNVLNHGVQLSTSQLTKEGAEKFKVEPVVFAGWVGAMSTGVALLISPVTIAFCRRKSTRVTAVMGGLITALGCLFTSFATQFHQLFFSYGAFVGIGVGITRDCSTLMVAQYFKRKREFVEIFIVSGSGLGIATMSTMIKSAVGALGWRLGLQLVTGAISTTFILGTCYRSASLYHPQRRAILHIKNQKRKIKDKNKIEDKIPFFDFSTLKSKTVRILLISTGISAFGINTPLFYLAYTAEIEGLGDYTMFLQVYLGLAWALGCGIFSLLVLNNNTECRIARQYLCQTAVFMCGLSILAFTVVSGNYSAYVMFAWIYGIFCGGYHYSLKMYTYERVRARNFARTWGFVQCSQAIPIVIGVPFSGYMNENCGDRSGYYFSSTCVIVGSLTLFMIDVHRRNISRHKHTRENGTKHLCVSDTCPQRRKLSFSQEPDNKDNALAATNATHLVLGAEIPASQTGLIDPMLISTEKPELTCISEEGIADMDFPDNLLDDLDYIGDCITSCNKVENYLMLSEFENNLIAEMPVILDRKGRRWSLARSKQPQAQNEENGVGDEENGNAKCNNAKWKLFPNRVITVIDESSV